MKRGSSVDVESFIVKDVSNDVDEDSKRGRMTGGDGQTERKSPVEAPIILAQKG